MNAHCPPLPPNQSHPPFMNDHCPPPSPSTPAQSHPPFMSDRPLPPLGKPLLPISAPPPYTLSCVVIIPKLCMWSPDWLHTALLAQTGCTPPCWPRLAAHRLVGPDWLHTALLAQTGCTPNCWPRLAAHRLVGPDWLHTALLAQTGCTPPCWPRLAAHRLVGPDWLHTALLAQTAHRLVGPDWLHTLLAQTDCTPPCWPRLAAHLVGPDWLHTALLAQIDCTPPCWPRLTAHRLVGPDWLHTLWAQWPGAHVKSGGPGFGPCFLQGAFWGLRHITHLHVGTPVDTLAHAWRYRVSTETSWPGVSILWLGEIASLVCYFCLSVAACTCVWADPSLRYTSMLLGREATSQQQQRQYTAAGIENTWLSCVLLS